MRMIRSIFIVCVTVLSLSACAINKRVTLTGCDHPSGWCDQIREIAKDSYVYAQLAANSYKSENIFVLPTGYKLKNVVPNDATGFSASIYEVIIKEKLTEVVIVYRGTETEDAKDWLYGNILYVQNEKGLELYDSIILNLPKDVSVTLVGHSLGGAIANYVSLRRSNMKIYVFNTSPHFTRGAGKSNPRTSIVEYGEALKIIRAPAIEATQTYMSINCSKGNLFAQHEQVRLAECLTRIAAAELEEAAVSLEKSTIEESKRLAEKAMRQAQEAARQAVSEQQQIQVQVQVQVQN